jgi:hypothetical protein
MSVILARGLQVPGGSETRDQVVKKEGRHLRKHA